MRIGIDISQIVYEGTGVATYTGLLVKELLKQGASEQFVLFGSSLRNRRPLKEYLKGLKTKNFRSKLAFLPPKILEFLWNGIHVLPIENFIGEVDVFHSSDWLEPPTSKARRITTIHDLTVFKYPETFFARGGHNIVANQKRKLFFVKQYSNLVIAVSETTKKDILEFLSIPEKKIHVIPEAADPAYFPRNEEMIRETKRKFLIDGDFLLCVGTREPRKNIDRVIMAFAEIAKAQPDLSLIIVGKYGWGEEKMSNVKGQMSNVKILGYVEMEDLAGLYSGARAFVYPSLYEGFGLPILEAMACGCPVITSETGALKEIAGKEAILVDPENIEDIVVAISKVCRNEKIRKEMVLGGLKRSGEFSWEKTALQTLEAYRSVLE